MQKKHKISKIIFSVATVIVSTFILSGCYDNEPREQVLRDVSEYDINPYEGGQEDGSSAVHRLSVRSLPENSNLPEQNSASADSTQAKQPPVMQIDQNKIYSAVIKTSEGDIRINLDAKKTPVTVNNFVALARENFYNETVFHRVIENFMIQGGDPKGDGSGGPGYKFDDENLEGKYVRGTVAMANSGPNTNGSQFFIIHQNYDLPNKYVIFGQISSGMETVDKIARAEVVDNGAGEKSKPVVPVKIDLVEIIEE